MIDMNKKYAFEGEEGTVLTVTGSLPAYPVVWQSGRGNVLTFTSEGRLSIGGRSVLIEVKPTRWINIYELHYSTKEEADEAAFDQKRIACIEFKEGDGL